MFDNDVPEPDDRKGRLPRGTSAYGFENMEVGQSFFVETDNINHSKLSSARQFAYRNGIKLKTRRIEENGVSGYRVWRVK